MTNKKGHPKILRTKKGNFLGKGRIGEIFYGMLQFFGWTPLLPALVKRKSWLQACLCVCMLYQIINVLVQRFSTGWSRPPGGSPDDLSRVGRDLQKFINKVVSV